MLWNRKAVQFPWRMSTRREVIGAAAPKTPDYLDGVSYDYVVVGSGSAGSALAATLAAGAPSASILVIEAGPTNITPLIQQFTNAMDLRGTVYDWNDQSQPQTCMDGQALPYDAGHTSGGSSSINGMVWVRGNPADYDGWAALGNSGWDFQSLLPIFMQQETFFGGDPKYRGQNGPVFVSTEFTVNPFATSLVDALVSYGLAFNADYNGATQDGAAYSQLNVNPSQIRQDAYSTMLAPLVNNSRVSFSNLALVTSIGISGGRAQSVSGWVTIVGVDPVIPPSLVPFTVNVTSEIILCAGALRSPQLLMLSGVGPAAMLKQYGIPVVVDLPGVGQNLQDQLVAAVVNPLTAPDPNHITAMDVNAWWGGSSNGAPQFELQSYYMLDNPGFPPDMFALGAIVLHPSSRGNVALQSNNPFQPPVIQPSLLCNPADMPQQLQGLKAVRQMMAQFQQQTGLVGEEYLPGPAVVSDEQLMQYINESAVPDFHYVGTCKMGSDSMAVVNSALQVYGVEGLRVADASIMPFVTSGNTNAPSMMIGGKCADLILDGS